MSADTESMVLMRVILIVFGIIIIILPFIAVVWLCKLLVDFIHRKLKVEDLTKYRNDYLIAFGAIGTFSVVLRILPYFPELGHSIIGPFMIVYVITTPAIYCFFVRPTFDKKCEWKHVDQDTCDMFVAINTAIHIALLFVSSKIAAKYDDEETRKLIFSSQLLWTFPSAISFHKFARVWWVGVQLINVNEGRNEVAARPVESIRPINKITVKPAPVVISRTVAPKPRCNICCFQYTETGIHTPRIIIACGHTICEQCVSKLLNVKCPKLLVCPFCQEPTIVNGPARTLPKNFALMEYRRDVVRQ